MHIHAQPVSGSMHEELPVGAVLDQRRQLALEQTQFDQALGYFAYCGIMRIIPVISRSGGSDGCVLRLQYHFVHGALLRTVTAIDRKRTRDIRGIKSGFATGINQQQITIHQLGIVFVIVQDATVRTASDNGMVGDISVVAVKFMEQFGHHLVFHATRLNVAQSTFMGAYSNRSRLTHQRRLAF